MTNVNTKECLAIVYKTLFFIFLIVDTYFVIDPYTVMIIKI